jgi:hypothetical protein
VLNHNALLEMLEAHEAVLAARDGRQYATVCAEGGTGACQVQTPSPARAAVLCWAGLLPADLPCVQFVNLLALWNFNATAILAVGDPLAPPRDPLGWRPDCLGLLVQDADVAKTALTSQLRNSYGAPIPQESVLGGLLYDANGSAVDASAVQVRRPCPQTTD